MKEIREILNAYIVAKAAGKKAALATVVKVEGSSYRQPGARMLVTEDGMLTGAISGGCLEGDALRKALLSIDQQANKLITYDTSNEDDIEFGVQLGCNGIVHILFEYINDDVVNNPIFLLQQLQTERKAGILLTLFSLDRHVKQIGTALFYREHQEPLYNNDLALSSLPAVLDTWQSKSTLIKSIAQTEQYALIEYIEAPLSLIIVGAGNDAQPLLKMAALIGWEVTVADGRATHATKKRFPDASRVIVSKADQLLDQIIIDPQTYFVLMTHNYNYDLTVLGALCETQCAYIGTLGPKTKLSRMRLDLQEQGVHVNDDIWERIYGPVGLDIGAETAEEIALAVVAEIKAVMMGKHGNSLKYKQEKIHQDIQVVANK